MLMEISAKNVKFIKSIGFENPVSTLSGKKPLMKTTTHWYLPMQDHENWLKDWIEKGLLNNMQHHDPNSWRSQVLGQ